MSWITEIINEDKRLKMLRKEDFVTFLKEFQQKQEVKERCIRDRGYQ